MVSYALDHLTQPSNQKVAGPIQDDEALLLYATIRVTRIKRVLEFGGLGGYSATNFLRATGAGGEVYSLDLNPVPKLAPNHFTIQKDARLISAEDVHSKPLDMVFFDCHHYDAQMAAFDTLSRQAVITDKTIIVFHDTNLFPTNDIPGYPMEDGYRPILPEAKMINEFKKVGYDIFCFHTDMKVHASAEEDLPYRWGVVFARKFKPLPLPDWYIDISPEMKDKMPSI